jgi:argininosuccinate lyase
MANNKPIQPPQMPPNDGWSGDKSYTASISYDRRLYKQDTSGSIAHVRMLASQGIISEKDAGLIVAGLTAIRQEIEEGTFPWQDNLEDIHMNIENRLSQKIGDVAGRMHTARSRNDQIALDMRMHVKEAIKNCLAAIRGLQKALIEVAHKNPSLIMPGYTHLQRAQPVLMAHHLLAYFHMLQRDALRFSDCYTRTNVLPLGSGALAGVPYPVDRQFLARELGFKEISSNSMDAVSDRDFLVEFQACAAICMMHISRLAEEIVVWSSKEFDFIRLDDTYVTGSSIMPQKRNPDYAELARGKTGRVYGHLLGILTVLKGLPLTYNRDLQEDKEGYFDTLDTLLSTLMVMSGMIRTMHPNVKRLFEASQGDNILATDLADYLVAKGLPFREAHGIVYRLVQYATEQGKSLAQLPTQAYRRISPLFEDDIQSLTTEASVRSRDVHGGTAPNQVEEALREAEIMLKEKLVI